MINKKKVYVVPHSHWDREWYFTIEDSNVLLTQNMPYLMDVLEGDLEYNSYTFDGQLSVVDEFLALYPEEKERLENLSKDKRIFVGPWYTQTDSLLVNKESIIRNLLYGMRIGEELGHSMKVGYLPDIFGQNAYLPSIFNGFGIEGSILQRGLYNDELKGNLNFKWVSPDKEEIKSNYIYLGYGPGKFLASDDEYLEDKLIPMLKKLEDLNKDTNNLLLPAGGDQVLVREKFPQIIKELNNKQDHYEFILSDYESFLKDTWEDKDFENTIEGELIACQKSRIHNTIKSQRYDIKKLNTSVENKILYVLEPILSIGKTLGLKYQTPVLRKMWKELFDVHAHDSIGGCNSDDTNRNIINRLIKVNSMCDGLLNISKKQITKAVSKKLNKENIILIFNTDLNKDSKTIEATIFTKNKEFTITNLNGKGVTFDLVNSEIISGGKQVVVTAEGEKQIELPGYYRSEIIIFNEEVKPLGYKVLEIKDGDINNCLHEEETTIIENEKYKIIISDKISLHNKCTGKVIEDLLYFEECADGGDSYDFSPIEGDKEILIKDLRIIKCEKSKNIQKFELLHSVELPRDIQERRVSKTSQVMDIYTNVELRSGEEFIRVSHNINNKVCDHRVRVILNSNITSKNSYADQGFSIIKRENENKYLNNWKENGFAEAPVSIFALENFVAIKEENEVFSAITKGIKEFEIINDKSIALTLFRSVGLLGKDDLLWRPGRASGINNKVVYTEDANMICKMDFEYAIVSKEDNDSNMLFDLTNKYINKYGVYQNQTLNLFEERLERFEVPNKLEVTEEEFSLIAIDNNKLHLSVLKESYERDGLIIRIFNPYEEDQYFKVSTPIFKHIIETNLYEKELNEKDEFKVKGKGYITLKLK
ncbi:glycoside hydrolase family 38 C-terminal domain-containing protein [Clostridium sp.]|uniref:glycoside hydrolase family 38 N-terminal domain-containing protein n=1 Tax=Clostridium sp. TaxID=1506 RepID=UPI002FC9D149